MTKKRGGASPLLNAETGERGERRNARQKSAKKVEAPLTFNEQLKRDRKNKRMIEIVVPDAHKEDSTKTKRQRTKW